MSEEQTPEWASQLFCQRAGINYSAIMRGENTVVLRVAVREGARMIAKYEQPPVDPDVEAVHRILSAWYENADFHHMDYANPGAFNAAVAQYKLERAK